MTDSRAAAWFAKAGLVHKQQSTGFSDPPFSLLIKVSGFYFQPRFDEPTALPWPLQQAGWVFVRRRTNERPCLLSLQQALTKALAPQQLWLSGFVE
jgi:hypothetical protein